LAVDFPPARPVELEWSPRQAVRVEALDFIPTEDTTMTENRLPLADLLQKSGEGDFLRAVAENVLQLLMEADVEGLVGAARHERSADRLTWRNGYCERNFDTRLGSLSLRVPKLRQGSYFPPFLEARRTTEKALVAVIQEAWIAGVSLVGLPQEPGEARP
jgi:putative transposase